MAAVDQPIEAGAWRVTIHSAVAATELHGHKADDGTYLIEVEATVRTTDNRSRKPYDAVTLEGIRTVPDIAPDLSYVSDDRLASDLQPGLPERITFGWAVVATTPVPKELDGHDRARGGASHRVLLPRRHGAAGPESSPRL